jgi:hypothetical protein
MKKEQKMTVKYILPGIGDVPTSYPYPQTDFDNFWTQDNGQHPISILGAGNQLRTAAALSMMTSNVSPYHGHNDANTLTVEGVHVRDSL